MRILIVDPIGHALRLGGAGDFQHARRLVERLRGKLGLVDVDGGVAGYEVQVVGLREGGEVAAPGLEGWLVGGVGKLWGELVTA